MEGVYEGFGVSIIPSAAPFMHPRKPGNGLD